MRLWLCIIISILAHGAFLFAPISISFNQELQQPKELQFIVLDEGDRNDAQMRQGPLARQPGHTEKAPTISASLAQEPPAKQAMDEPAESTQRERKEDEARVEKKDEAAAARDRPSDPDHAIKEIAAPQAPQQRVKIEKRTANALRREKSHKTKSVRSVRPRTPEPPRRFAKQKTSSQRQQTHDAESQTAATVDVSPVGRKKNANSGPREVSFGSQSGPAFRSRALPKYPLAARQMGKEGTVHLRLTIDRQGHLIKVEVVYKAGWGFDDEAVRAVKHSTFRPARIDGEPVTCIAHLQIRFELRSAK